MYGDISHEVAGIENKAKAMTADEVVLSEIIIKILNNGIIIFIMLNYNFVSLYSNLFGIIMKYQDFILLSFWIAIPLIIILCSAMSGCSPLEVKIVEQAAEEVIEEDLKGK